MVVTATPRYPVTFKGIKEKDVKELTAKLNKPLKEKVDLCHAQSKFSSKSSIFRMLH